MGTPDPVEQKRSLRTDARRARRASAASRQDPDALDAAQLAIADAVLSLVPSALPGRSRGRTGRVACYLSLPDEPPTGALVEGLRARGVEVIVPIVLPDFDLDWRSVGADERADATTVARREVREGDGALGPGAIGGVDLVVAPALLVDRHGRRLGQGGGCYDRALARVAASVPVVALVFDEELVDGPLPMDEHDRGVHAVVTPGHGLRWLRRPSA